MRTCHYSRVPLCVSVSGILVNILRHMHKMHKFGKIS